MAEIEWIEGDIPAGMEIRQVYGIILDRKGRVMLRTEERSGGIRYSLAGGRPEPWDPDMEATCRRELLEEVNTEIETPEYIGYQLVDEEDGTPRYAQARMAALIRRIGERKPDPDNGKTYGRYMAAPERAAELLAWGETGYAQIMKARDTVYRKYGINRAGCEEEWV